MTRYRYMKPSQYFYVILITNVCRSISMSVLPRIEVEVNCEHQQLESSGDVDQQASTLTHGSEK